MISLRLLRFVTVSIIPPMLHTHLHLKLLLPERQEVKAFHLKEGVFGCWGHNSEYFNNLCPSKKLCTWGSYNKTNEKH